MFRLLKMSALLIGCFVCLQNVGAANLSYDNYTTLHRLSTMFSQNFLDEQIDDYVQLLSTKQCRMEFNEHKKTYVMTASCFFEGKKPTMSFENAIDAIWPYVVGFEKVYDHEAKQFSYDATQPKIDFTRKPIMYDGKKGQIALLAKLSMSDLSVEIPAALFAMDMIKEYSFYAVSREKNILENVGPCSRNNYNLVLNSLDGLLLYPQQSFTINHHVAGRDGFCTGTGPKIYQFYGGSCGASTQLYRVGLLHPFINIEQRANHSLWYSQYYGEYMFGDDAAIYEDEKKLKIRNMHNKSVYFKVINDPYLTYLVGVSPIRINHSVTVTKEQIAEKQAKVQKFIKDSSGELTELWEWVSTYRNVL